MSNGLDDLSGRRRKRRETPPPKHPRSEQQPPPPPASAPAAEPDPGPAQETEPRAAAAGAPAEPVPETTGRSDARRSKRTPSVETSLDEELLDWLWQVEAAAVAQRMRSVNSPVMRLALRRLREQMSPEEVVQVLRENPPKPTGRPGRPRR